MGTYSNKFISIVNKEHVSILTSLMVQSTMTADGQESNVSGHANLLLYQSKIGHEV